LAIILAVSAHLMKFGIEAAFDAEAFIIAEM
jgi:hypothetical protein